LQNRDFESWIDLLYPIFKSFHFNSAEFPVNQCSRQFDFLIRFSSIKEKSNSFHENEFFTSRTMIEI